MDKPQFIYGGMLEILLNNLAGYEILLYEYPHLYVYISLSRYSCIPVYSQICVLRNFNICVSKEPPSMAQINGYHSRLSELLPLYT